MTKITGFSLLLFFVVSLSFGIWSLSTEGLIAQTEWENVTFAWMVSICLPILIGIFIFLYISLVMASLFPSLQMTSEGIKYKSFFSNGLIQWEECEGFTKARSKLFRNVNVLLISRKGANFLTTKGLWLNFAYGLWLGVYQPVLPITQDTNIIDQIKKAITSRNNEDY